MTEDIKNKLLMCAEIYHCADFITSDPVQFPHRYTLKQDIEISGLLTAIMSFGNRKQILKKADELHRLMGDSPYQYVLSRQWEVDFPSGVTNSFYRMLSYADFYGYFRRLYAAYTQFESLEETLNAYSGIPMEKLCSFLEVSAKSPQKKLNMFLRWMIRRDSAVDFGIWNYNPSDIDMVQAYTNPIYAVLSIIPNFFNLDVVLFFKIFSILILVLFSIWFIKKTKKSWLMLLIFISIPATIIHLFSGLETFFYIFLTSVLLISLYEENFWTSIIVTVLLFFTRGESWLLVGLVPFYFLWKSPYFNFNEIKNNPINYFKPEKFNISKFVISFLVLTLSLVVLFMFHYYQFGSVLPNTF